MNAELERLREAVEYAADAFLRAADEHACDYCRADAARMHRALGTQTTELRGQVAQLRAALRAIEGPSDSEPWIGIYRGVGGGYCGLQAIAHFALELS